MKKSYRKICAAFLAAAMTVCPVGCGSAEDSGDASSKQAAKKEEEKTLPWSDEAWEAGASGIEKEETVHVKADAKGNPEETSATETLKLPENCSLSMIPDQSDLTGIRNTEGDEEYVQREDGSILWENKGEDITYEGDSEKELPVSVKVTYILDDEEIEPEELAGKSGHVTIRFDYENTLKTTVKTQKADLDSVDFDEDDELEDVDDYTVPQKEVEVETVVPVIAVTAALLGDDFENVEVTNGELIEMSGRNMVVGYAAPGLSDALKLTDCEITEDVEIPEYVEFSADVTDFSLDFTATMMGTDLLDDLKEEDLQDIDDMSAGMTLMEKAADALADGSGELTDGAKDLKDAIKSYMDGVSELKSGIKSLSSGLKKIDEALSGLDLSSSGTDSSKKLESAMTSLAADMKSVASGVSSIESYYKQVKAAKEAVKSIDTSEMSDENKAAVDKALNELSDIKEPDLSFATSAMKDMEKQMKTVTSALSSVADGASSSAKQLKSLQSGISKLSSGAKKLSSGAKTLTGYNSKIEKGLNSLVDGCKEFEEGCTSFYENGVKKMSEKTGDPLVSLISRVRALKEADGSYTNFAGIHPDMEGSVSFLIETEEIE